MSFAAFVGYARNMFHRGPGTRGVIKGMSIPLYLRIPSGVALYAPPLIALDVFLMMNTVNVTWRNFKNPPSTEDGKEGPKLRSPRIRLAVCALEVAVGLFIASSLMIYRGQTAKLISILPPKNPNAKPGSNTRRIFLQTAGNWRHNGTIYPLSACTLTRVTKEALLLQVQGMYGGWQLNIDANTIVDGDTFSSEEKACKTLAEHWKAAGGKGTILTEEL